MRARQIEVFRMVMRTGSLTAAAKALNVSQPGLSRLLRHAEDELGIRLFDRVKGRLVPTPEAEQLYPDVETIFDDLQRLRLRARQMKDSKGGLVRLAASAPASFTLVPDALGRFRAADPSVRIQSYVIPAESIVQMLDEGRIDLGLALTDRPFASIESEIIGQAGLVCVLPEGHRLARREVVGCDDIAGEVLISYRPDSLPAQLLQDAFASEGQTFRPDMEIDVSISALAFVQRGLGIAIVDGLLPWQEFRGLVARPFSPAIVLPLCLMTSGRRPLSHHAARLREQLLAASKRLGLSHPAASAP